MLGTFTFGSRVIEYRLEYSSRKSLGITVTPDMDVIVKAPEKATMEQIDKKLRKRAPWIIRQQEFFLSFQPKTPPRRYVNGETHLYMGRQYRLNISVGDKNMVKLKGAFIEVCARPGANVEKLVKKWYHDHAEEKFRICAAPLIQKFEKYGVSPSSVQLREMPRRWGSCTTQGKIILNPELIKAPKGCIEYVITHELCHLVHHDHTKKFMELQEKEMPDWKKWKTVLENLLA